MAARLCWPPHSVDETDASRASVGVALVSIALACVLAYGPMLAQFFTGTDTITLIETSRITNVQDIRRIVAEPLMAGSDFLQVARFYRPLSTISYSIDYWLWGVHPAGFHFTNLLLHTLTCMFIFLMMRASFGLGLFPAGLGTITFALHPILVETVPSIDRRHDIIAALFIVLCVIFCAKYLASRYHDRRYLWASVACEVAAMASKETAFFLPALLLVFIGLFVRAEAGLTRIRTILRMWLPYAISAFLYMVWRMYVLGGVGGYTSTRHGSWAEKERYVGQMAASYLYDLLSPIDSMWQPVLTTTLSIALLGAALALLPLASEYMGSRKIELALQTDKRPLYKIRIFLLCWLFMPLAVFAFTLTFGHRGMYIPTIALSCLIALNFQAVSRRVQGAHARGNAKPAYWDARRLLAALSKTAAVAASVVVVCLMIRYSPLVCNYGAWQASAQLSSHLLRQFLISASILPDKSCVVVNQAPDSLENASDGSPQPKEVAFPQGYSFSSWLKLYLPSSHARVILGKRSRAKYFSGFVRFSNYLWTKKTLVVFVSMGRPHKTR
ncbi:MAG: hypothetical protein ACP5M0_14105 [Desulfomonilaceae bacterium]